MTDSDQNSFVPKENIISFKTAPELFRLPVYTGEKYYPFAIARILEVPRYKGKSYIATCNLQTGSPELQCSATKEN